MLRICSILVLLFCVDASPFWAAQRLEGHARVLDGDTLEVAGITLRLFGIDAPERNQQCDRKGLPWNCGVWSATELQQTIDTRPVECDLGAQDRYGRSIAQCRVHGQDLSRAQIRAGAALAYRRYSTQYIGDETTARQNQKGIWAARMVTPEAHRHAKALPLAAQSDTACLIKGNISANGRIFHSPGQRDYDRTQINPATGEAWFCTPSEAKAAGFRAARR